MEVTIKLLNGKEYPLSEREVILDVDKQEDLNKILKLQKVEYFNETGGEMYGPGLERIFDKDGNYVLRNVKTKEVILDDCEKIVPIFKRTIFTGSSTGPRCSGMIYYQIAYTEDNWLLCYKVTYTKDRGIEPKYEFKKIKYCMHDKLDGRLIPISGYKIKSNKDTINEIKEYIRNSNQYFQISSILSELQALNIIDKSNVSLVIQAIDGMTMNGELERKTDDQRNIYYEVKSLSKPYAKSLNRK